MIGTKDGAIPGAPEPLPDATKPVRTGIRTARVLLLNTLARRFGIERNAKYRALRWLEQAGLVSVENNTGQAPRVTLLDPEDAS